MADDAWLVGLDDDRDDHRTATVGAVDPAPDNPAHGLLQLVGVVDTVGHGPVEGGPAEHLGGKVMPRLAAVPDQTTCRTHTEVGPRGSARPSASTFAFTRASCPGRAAAAASSASSPRVGMRAGPCPEGDSS